MKTPILPLTVLISSALALPAPARVGETEAQCVARYGKPLREVNNPTAQGDKTSVFRKAAFEIKAVFDDGRAKSVTYSRIPKLGKSGSIGSAEQMRLMRNNGGNKDWKKLQPTKADDKYETTDGKLRGRYNRDKKYLEVYDTAWNKSLNRLKSAAKRAEASALADLRGL